MVFLICVSHFYTPPPLFFISLEGDLYFLVDTF